MLANLIGWLAAIVIGVVLFVGAISALGEMVDGIGQHDQDRDRCLRHATSGYEIKQCH